ncbi:prepilin peptidase [Lachnospiraceae bacterium 54-53]
MIQYFSPAIITYTLFLTALLGASSGSFAACMAARIVSGEDFLRGRSHCDRCGHVLTGRDLIPIVSWFLLKGKCRWCGERVSVRCPITEILCAAAFAGLVLRYDISLQTLQYLILTVLLLTAALVDYDSGVIPNGLLLAMIVDWLAFTPFLNGGGFVQNLAYGLAGGLIASVPLLLLSLLMDLVLKKESMGGGDIKLFFAAGLFFSWRGVLFLIILSCILGIVFALATRKTTGNEENPKAFPFGPAIAAGVYVSLLAAEPLMDMYFNLFQA